MYTPHVHNRYYVHTNSQCDVMPMVWFAPGGPLTGPGSFGPVAACTGRVAVPEYINDTAFRVRCQA
jgi:hypothetical protein